MGGVPTHMGEAPPYGGRPPIRVGRRIGPHMECPWTWGKRRHDIRRPIRRVGLHPNSHTSYDQKPWMIIYGHL